MHYYRKAAAVFILIFALALPFFLEAEAKVAVVEIKTLIAESEYLSSKAAQNKNPEALEAEILKIAKKAVVKFAADNNYSSVVTKHLIYKGGTDISREIARIIDAEN
jgi:hypothetical protein